MRKKTLLLISLLIIFSGCGPKPTVTVNASEGCPPSWYLKAPTAEDALYGVGDAKRPQQSLTRKTATARARSEVASAAQIKVASMLKDHMLASGVGNDARATEFNEYVSKEVTNLDANFTIIKETQVCTDGTIYVLMEYSLNAVWETALDAAREKEALYNEFKAKQSFEELENAIKTNNIN